MPIDAQTYQSYRIAELVAQRTGRSLPEVLDSRRLLLTEEREHQIRVDVLESMQKRLGQKTIGDLIRVFDDGHLVYGSTPEQVFKLMGQWVDTFVAAVKTKTLE